MLFLPLEATSAKRSDLIPPVKAHVTVLYHLIVNVIRNNNSKCRGLGKRSDKVLYKSHFKQYCSRVSVRIPTRTIIPISYSL